MSAGKQHRHAAFVRFDKRLQEFHKNHPVLFYISTIGIALVGFSIAQLINYLFQWVRK
jgi:hypothetical protein